jgi:deoxyribodipyrimidine photolyase
VTAAVAWFRRDPQLGVDYPATLVDLRESRAEAISRFRDQRG